MAKNPGSHNVQNQKTNRKKAKSHISPLTSSLPADAAQDDGETHDEHNFNEPKDVNDDPDKRIRKRGYDEGDESGDRLQGRLNRKKRAPMSQKKKIQEAALTEMIFGNVSGTAGVDDVVPFEEDRLKDTREPGNDDDGAAAWQVDGLFAIDRRGVEMPGEENEERGAGDDEEQLISFGADQESHGSNDSDDDVDSDDNDDDDSPKFMKRAAWQDDDDDEPNESGISLMEGSNRIKKLRRYRDETNPISIRQYESRLRERFINTASLAARTDWATVPSAPDNGNDDQATKKHRDSSSSTEEESDDDSSTSSQAPTNDIFHSNASLLATSSSTRHSLPPTILDVMRRRDANLSDPNKSVVNAVQFHRNSHFGMMGNGIEDGALLMTAGMDKMLRFFRVDGEDNPKIHGVQFPTLPIMCASFLGDSGTVVLSGRRPFFYVYDTASGNIERIPSIMGRKERSLEKFVVSPDGRIIAFLGNDGYIILVDAKSRQWIADFKMNGSVRAVTFTPNGEFLLGSGSDGDVYRWDLRSQRCIERFHNEDGTITSSLAVSSSHLAVGAESGVVNLYHEQQRCNTYGNFNSLAATTTIESQTPIKSIMNMQSSADAIKFNEDGQILAMSTRRETNGLKLLHVPTATVFSNWPTSKTPLKYVWSMDFSPMSKYLAVGNDHGKCLLYQLKHYWDK